MTSTLGASSTDATTESSGTLATAKDKALEKTEEMREKVGSQLTSKVHDQVDQRSTQVGEQVSSVVSALQTTASNLRSEDQTAPAKALDTVTQQVEKVGTYLTETSSTQLLNDLEAQARRRPWAVAATLFGVGFAASRVLSASSKSRYASSTGGGSTMQGQHRSTFVDGSVDATRQTSSVGGGYGGSY